jgi:DNA-directed RNA polymerase specialized sigma subunit
MIKKLTKELETELLASYNNGDLNALNDLCSGVKGIAVSMVNRTKGLSYDEREDLVQDCLLYFYRMLPKYDVTRSRLTTYAGIRFRTCISNYFSTRSIRITKQTNYIETLISSF